MFYKTLFIKIPPHKFFLWAAIFLGVTFNLITPPLQAPDEHDHFRRVYHISEGHFLPEKKDNRLGGEIPVCFKQFFLPYRNLATNLKYTVTKETIFNSFQIPFNNNKKEFEDFPNTSYYSPISYLPQVFAVSVLKQFNCSTGTIYYGGRIFIYLIWLISMYFFIKIVPVCKWLFTFLILLPMNVFISNSYSADTVTIILSFLFIGLVLKYAFDEEYFTNKRLVILVSIAVLLALSKVVYVALALSFFIIPHSKFKTKNYFAFSAATLLACSFIVALIWSKVVTHYFTPYYQYNEAYKDYCCLSHCANYDEQKNYILNHGTYLFKVIFNSLFRHPYTYLSGYIGNFGNSDMPLPKWLLLLTYFIILLFALTEKNLRLLTKFQKTVFVFASFCAFALLILSQHLTWDCVGEGIVDIVQGRYLIPLFPLVFLLLSGSFLKIKINQPLFTILLLSILSVYSFKIIYNRYFVESYISKTEFECGAEEVNEYGLFNTTNSNITIDGVASQNNKIFRTGKFSVLLSEKTPYGLTYKFKNLCYGDLIEISAWQKGTGAQLIVAGKGKNCGEFYYPNKLIKYSDKNGWDKMEYVFTMNLKCLATDSTEVTFFLWNPEKTETYIDDLKFSLKKFDTNYLDNKLSFFE